MYLLKNVNQIKRRLSLLKYISWKSVALLNVILEACTKLIYLQTSLRGFHLLLHSKNSQHVSICQQLLHLYHSIFPIWLLLDDCCWKFSSESLSSSFEEARGFKEYGTNLLGSLQLNRFSISELSLSLSLSVTLDILENHRYLLCFCILTLIILKINCFLNVFMS